MFERNVYRSSAIRGMGVQTLSTFHKTSLNVRTTRLAKIGDGERWVFKRSSTFDKTSLDVRTTHLAKFGNVERRVLKRSSTFHKTSLNVLTTRLAKFGDAEGWVFKLSQHFITHFRKIRSSNFVIGLMICAFNQWEATLLRLRQLDKCLKSVQTHRTSLNFTMKKGILSGCTKHFNTSFDFCYRRLDSAKQRKTPLNKVFTYSQNFTKPNA